VDEWISVCIAGGLGGIANVALDFIDSDEGDRSVSVPDSEVRDCFGNT